MSGMSEGGLGFSVADDRVDDKRVPFWARYVVGVVALVEGNGFVGLV
jgi:hypothetical protein